MIFIGRFQSFAKHVFETCVDDSFISFQLLDAATMLANHQLSKITQENLEIFMDVWETQVDELLTLLKNIFDAETNETCK